MNPSLAAGIFLPVNRFASAPPLRFRHDLNHIHQLTLIAGRELRAELPQGLYHLRLRWRYFRRQHQTAVHHQHINGIIRHPGNTGHARLQQH